MMSGTPKSSFGGKVPWLALYAVQGCLHTPPGVSAGLQWHSARLQWVVEEMEMMG